jgi:hypothetical protein
LTDGRVSLPFGHVVTAAPLTLAVAVLVRGEGVRLPTIRSKQTATADGCGHSAILPFCFGRRRGRCLPSCGSQLRGSNLRRNSFKWYASASLIHTEIKDADLRSAANSLARYQSFFWRRRRFLLPLCVLIGDAGGGHPAILPSGWEGPEQFWFKEVCLAGNHLTSASASMRNRGAFTRLFTRFPAL